MKHYNERKLTIMSKKVSMKDMAEELGVSVALVSYVLNGKMTNRINADTADKIKKLAEKYNYRPNQIAKSLKSNRTYTIGLVVADISNIFYSSIARHIEEEANSYGYHVVFGSAYEDPLRFKSLVEVFMDKQVDGLILAVPDGGEEYLSIVQDINIPYVILDREFDSVAPEKIINIDNYRASQAVVEHFNKAGFKKLGAIALKSNLKHLEKRKKGFTDAVSAHYVGDEGLFYEIVENELEDKIEQTVLHALHVDKVDALYFLTNRIAMAGLGVLARYNITVPEQVGVVCFDEADAYHIFRTEVTYVRQPLKEMSQQAVRTILNKPLIGKSPKFDTVLIARASSTKDC